MLNLCPLLFLLIFCSNSRSSFFGFNKMTRLIVKKAMIKHRFAVSLNISVISYNCARSRRVTQIKLFPYRRRVFRKALYST